MISSRRPPTCMPGIPSCQPLITPVSGSDVGWPLPSFQDASNCLPPLYRTPTYWTVTVDPAFAAGPVPVIRSLITSRLGGVPVWAGTVGLIFSAAGSGVVLAGAEVVLEADAEAEAEADDVTAAAVAPPLGASWTPGAFELPQAARPAARARRTAVMDRRLIIEG